MAGLDSQDIHCKTIVGKENMWDPAREVLKCLSVSSLPAKITLEMGRCGRPDALDWGPGKHFASILSTVGLREASVRERKMHSAVPFSNHP